MKVDVCAAGPDEIDARIGDADRCAAGDVTDRNRRSHERASGAQQRQMRGVGEGTLLGLLRRAALRDRADVDFTKDALAADSDHGLHFDSVVVILILRVFQSCHRLDVLSAAGESVAEHWSRGTEGVVPGKLKRIFGSGRRGVARRRQI